jgi:hypothetical protein
MPILFLAVILIQVTFIVHAVRTGRQQPWVLVLLLLPGLGSLAYFLVEILPELAQTRRGRRVAGDMQTILDPDREYRERKAQVELSGTPAAKAALADECLRKQMYDDAAALYRSALAGHYSDDPNLLLGFARVLIEKGDFADCQQALDHLRAKNPEFSSQDGHLIYARALEGQGKNDEAASEYEAVSGYFAGFEAKVRYGLFLQKLGRVDKARELLTGVVNAFKSQPRHAQDLNRDWYNVARRNLEG